MQLVQRIKTNESGRSMVEILGVLAVIGILSFLAVIGYRYAMEKQRANLVVQEAHIAYFDTQNANLEETNWKEVSFVPKNGYAMYTGKDVDGDTFVLVEGVEPNICRLMLPMGGHDELRFYHEIEHDETDMGELIVCPEEPVDIVVAFNETGTHGKNCETNEDCAESERGYCNAEAGICYECPENTEPSPSQMFCNPICEDDFETSCWAGDVKWCCPDTQVCGENPNECPDSDGFCKYQLKEMAFTWSAECAYEILPVSYELKAECVYEVLPVSSYEKAAECWYTIPTLTTGDVLTLSEGKGCGSNQYCLLRFDDKTCLSNISSDNKTGVVYGVCNNMNETHLSCGIDMTSASQPVMKEVIGCSDNRYCTVKYKDNSCGQVADASHIGYIYGTCSEKKENPAVCNYTTESTNVPVMKEIIGCSDNRYCILKYTDDTCEGVAQANHKGRIYGSCMNKNENSTTCVRKVSGLDDLLTSVVACPEAQYCYLNYLTKGCTDKVGATGANPFYGLCLDKDSNNLVCPVTE